MYRPQGITFSRLELSNVSIPHFVPSPEDYAKAGLQRVTNFPSEDTDMVDSSYPDPETLESGTRLPYWNLPAHSLLPLSPEADYPDSFALSPTLPNISIALPVTTPNSSSGSQPPRGGRLARTSRLCTCGCARFLPANLLREHAVARWESVGLISGPIVALFRASKNAKGRRGLHECLCGCEERFTRSKMMDHFVAKLNAEGKLLPLEWAVFEEKREGAARMLVSTLKWQKSKAAVLKGKGGVRRKRGPLF